MIYNIADLIYELKKKGEKFMRQNDDMGHLQENNLRVATVVKTSDKRYLNKRIITKIDYSKPNWDHSYWIHNPMYRRNWSLHDPIITNLQNKAINTSECYPPSLIKLAFGILTWQSVFEESIKEDFLERVWALFFCWATPAHFIKVATRDNIWLLLNDLDWEMINMSGDYVLSDELFFDLLEHDYLPGFDIHDIVHHSLQFRYWKDFFNKMGKIWNDIIKKPVVNEIHLHLIRFILMTTLEYSIVSQENKISSFWCLNWQSPRKSPLEIFIHQDEQDFTVNKYPFGSQTINKRNTLRWLCSLYRRQLEAEYSCNCHIDWLDKLWYKFPKEFQSLIQPFASYSLSQFEIDIVNSLEIEAPKDANILFENAEFLLKEYSLME